MLRVLIGLAAVVIVIAGVRTAEAILIPFLLSAFISAIAATPLFWLQRHGVPTALALLAVIASVVLIGVVLGGLIGTSVREFTDSLPFYEQRLRNLADDGIALLDSLGFQVSKNVMADYFDPGMAMRMVGRTMTGLGAVLSNIFLILVTVSFILLEAWSFPVKLREILRTPEHSLPAFGRFIHTMNRYMAIKSIVSVATGVLVGLMLWGLGVDFPLLWGTLAFLLNFVPNLGSLLASIPAILLTVIQLGFGHAAVVAVGYFAINVLMGNFIEPRYMGRGLGLSTLVVWLSLVFWGWALGPVGMLLSVPLTMTIKIAFEANPQTRWIAVLLGPAATQTEAPETSGPSGERAEPA